MSNYPADIEAFQQSIFNLRGITSIESGVDDLGPVGTELLSLPDYAHLPHAALRRTNGGREDEVLLQFEFRIAPNTEGLQALEFLAWFVRDSARGGRNLQLRPFALPPAAPHGRQLGETLRFHLELFADGIADTLEPAFTAVRELTEKLNLAVALYQIPLK